MADKRPRVAIVDHGLGNLYSVKHACQHVGLEATITSARQEILTADAVILPGVGAFGDAMDTLRRLDLISVLRDLAASPRPLVGICLGVQLLMTESYEFGHHKGLGIIEGTVVRFDNPREVEPCWVRGERILKVPQIGWNRVRKYPPAETATANAWSGGDPWSGTLLEGTPDGEYMYFVHSFVVQPQDSAVVLSTTRYGHIEFCSSVRLRSVFASQFHPERSGLQGLKIYRNLACALRHTPEE